MKRRLCSIFFANVQQSLYLNSQDLLQKHGEDSRDHQDRRDVQGRSSVARRHIARAFDARLAGNIAVGSARDSGRTCGASKVGEAVTDASASIAVARAHVGGLPRRRKAKTLSKARSAPNARTSIAVPPLKQDILENDQHTQHTKESGK